MKELENFENSQGDDWSEEQEKQYKDTAKDGLKWDQKWQALRSKLEANRRFDEVVYL